jgi:hypothetical protein
MMSDLKTKPNNADVEAFLNTIEDNQKKADSLDIVELMQEESGFVPRMWGDSIIGFGSYHYKYASGREGDWFLCGFSPRKQALTLYIMAGFEQYEDLLKSLGKFKTGKSCLYVKKLEDVNREVLRELVKLSVEHMASSGI